MPLTVKTSDLDFLIIPIRREWGRQFRLALNESPHSHSQAQDAWQGQGWKQFASVTT